LTAEDQKNKGNQSTVTIVNDKDRLTPQEIAKLIEEARKFDAEDER